MDRQLCQAPGDHKLPGRRLDHLVLYTGGLRGPPQAQETAQASKREKYKSKSKPNPTSSQSLPTAPIPKERTEQVSDGQGGQVSSPIIGTSSDSLCVSESKFSDLSGHSLISLKILSGVLATLR